MTKIETEIIERIKGKKIENIHARFVGKENTVYFDVLNEQCVELSERLSKTNPSSDFLIELVKIAKGE